MATYDVHIKGGTVVDGTRMPRYQADVWLRDGAIVQIGGRAAGSSARVIDAAGCIVAPGFIDLHTHYDAQVHWDPYCSISGWHGVTSVAMGNCGFGFAPCKPDYRERSMLTMTRTEAIPFEAMQEGMLPNWDWETIPEYLDTLDRIPKGVNALQYMPTASLMTYVMGLDAARSRPATDTERRRMQELLDEGMGAGLCGFSIQRLGPQSNQTDFDGSPMVTDTMCDEDILALAEVLRERDEGFIQITQQTVGVGHVMNPVDDAFKWKLAEISGRPVLDNLVPMSQTDPSVHRAKLSWLEKAHRAGLRIFGQASTNRTAVIIRLDDWNLFDFSPAWKLLTTGTLEEKIAKIGNPAYRDAVKRESADAAAMASRTQGIAVPSIRDLVVLAIPGDPALTARHQGRSLGDIANDEGKHELDVMLDLALSGGLRTEFLGSLRRGASEDYNADHAAEVYNSSPYTLPGVSDGGAHTKFFTGGAWTTDLLVWLVRETGLMTLEDAHFRMSALSAHAAGFRERGILREGAPADVLVYDLDALAVEPEQVGTVAYDMPAGAWRRIQRARGYHHILVNGVETFTYGECTGATPGRLLRHGR